MFKNMEKASLLTGAALGLTATTLLPVLKTTLRALTIVGVRGAIDLADSTKSTLKLAREEIEDIIAEAQFERMKNQLNEEIGQQ
ncbi:MAG: DUF5132 domain-containing protein [Desulfitobacteriaceae bacterium]